LIDDKRLRSAREAAVTAFLLIGLGCGRRSGTEGAAPGRSAGERSVVVYSSADKEFAELIFKAYETKSGVKVLPVYDTEETKTAGLTARLLAEASHPRADVFWSSDTSRALALAGRGIAAAYASPSAAMIPARYKDASGRWTGFAARIRVLLYNTEKVKPNEVPASVFDLAKPAWKGRFAFANPHFGTMSFHAAALFVALGDAKAIELFRALKENGAVVAAGNADVKDRVSDGRVAAGLVDEDDAVVAIREKKPVAIAILDQAGGELGTPVMPNTAMLVAGAPHPEEAKRFLDFLLSSEPEAILAKSDAAQYPLHPDVPGPGDLPSLAKIRPMDVGYDAVARKLPEMDAAMKGLFGI
jgi:iron(III) transport system substrate-binding protein